MFWVWGIGVLFGDASEELTFPVLGLCPINCVWDPFSGIGPFSLVWNSEFDLYPPGMLSEIS